MNCGPGGHRCKTLRRWLSTRFGALRTFSLPVWRNERLPDIDVRTARFESVLLVFLLLAFLVDEVLPGTMN